MDEVTAVPPLGCSTAVNVRSVPPGSKTEGIVSWTLDDPLFTATAADWPMTVFVSSDNWSVTVPVAAELSVY